MPRVDIGGRLLRMAQSSLFLRRSKLKIMSQCDHNFSSINIGALTKSFMTSLDISIQSPWPTSSSKPVSFIIYSLCLSIADPLCNALENTTDFKVVLLFFAFIKFSIFIIKSFRATFKQTKENCLFNNFKILYLSAFSLNRCNFFWGTKYIKCQQNIIRFRWYTNKIQYRSSIIILLNLLICFSLFDNHSGLWTIILFTMWYFSNVSYIWYNANSF